MNGTLWEDEGSRVSGKGFLRSSCGVSGLGFQRAERGGDCAVFGLQGRCSHNRGMACGVPGFRFSGSGNIGRCIIANTIFWGPVVIIIVEWASKPYSHY